MEPTNSKFPWWVLLYSLPLAHSANQVAILASTNCNEVPLEYYVHSTGSTPENFCASNPNGDSYEYGAVYLYALDPGCRVSLYVGGGCSQGSSWIATPGCYDSLSITGAILEGDGCVWPLADTPSMTTSYTTEYEYTTQYTTESWPTTTTNPTWDDSPYSTTASNEAAPTGADGSTRNGQSSNDNDGGSSGGLSRTDIIAPGVGVPSAIAGIATLWMCCRRKRR